MLLFVAFGGLMASLAAGYGVLFTIVDDYRDEYGISETAIGVVIGIGFVAATSSTVRVSARFLPRQQPGLNHCEFGTLGRCGQPPAINPLLLRLPIGTTMRPGIWLSAG